MYVNKLFFTSYRKQFCLAYYNSFTHFLDEEFFPEPNSFQPERFLKENADNLVEFTWRPFGSGQRVCIGQRFAMTEMKIFLAKFVSKFKINEVPETKFVPSCGSIFLNLYETLIVELVERQTQ